MYTSLIAYLNFLTIFVFFSCMFTGCAITQDYGSVQTEIPVANQPKSDYYIQSGDLLDIKFPYTEKHNEQVVVRPDGAILIQVAGEVKAAQKTPLELADAIARVVSHRLKNPEVIVKVAQSAQKIFVAGEVESQGSVAYRDDLTPLQAISERGGFKNTANSSKVFIITLEKDMAKVHEMDLAQIASRKLSANDVVFVPKTGVAKANLVVEQYIRNMVPLETYRISN